MFDTHPDHASCRIELRQQIVKQGMEAARHPGDFAALREKIGQMLITTGERVRGRRHRTILPVAPSGRVTQLAP